MSATMTFSENHRFCENAQCMNSVCGVTIFLSQYCHQYQHNWQDIPKILQLHKNGSNYCLQWNFWLWFTLHSYITL